MGETYGKGRKGGERERARLGEQPVHEVNQQGSGGKQRNGGDQGGSPLLLLLPPTIILVVVIVQNLPQRNNGDSERERAEVEK